MSTLGAGNALPDDHFKIKPRARTSRDCFTDDEIADAKRSRANTREEADILQHLEEAGSNVKSDLANAQLKRGSSGMGLLPRVSEKAAEHEASPAASSLLAAAAAEITEPAWRARAREYKRRRAALANNSLEPLPLTALTIAEPAWRVRAREYKRRRAALANNSLEPLPLTALTIAEPAWRVRAREYKRRRAALANNSLEPLPLTALTTADNTSDQTLQSSPCLDRVLKLAKTSFASTDAKDLLSRADAELKLIKTPAGKIAALVTHVPAEPTSSNKCRAFTLLQKGEIVGSSNACTEFLLLNQSNQVVGASNRCRAFVVLGKAGEPVESSNACTDFVLGCTFDEAAARCGDDMNSQAMTELHIEFVHPVANSHALSPELSYDPLARYTQLAKQHKQPRGFKTLEHERALRASNPSLGSLAPRVDRPSPHELTYDPLARYTQLAKQHKQPRGFKTLEHLTALRASSPKPCQTPSTSTQISRRVSFREEEIEVVHLETHRPSAVMLVSAHGHARRGVRVSSKKSPRLSPHLTPRAKSPKASPRSNPISPGLRHATVAMLMDALELPSSLVKSVKRAELDHLLTSRCSRYTLAAQRAPKLFQVGQRGIR